MNRKIWMIVLMVALTAACEKSEPAYDTSPLYPEIEAIRTPSISAVKTFTKEGVNHYSLPMYRFLPETNRWSNNILSNFPVVPPDDPAVIGFVNNNVEDSGVALFDMVRIYTPELGGTNIKEAKINAPRVLRFYPSTEGSKSGIVEVIKQDVELRRNNGTKFKIGISGQGTYSEDTKVIDLEVVFDEKALVEGQKRTVKYKLSRDPISLN